MPPITKRRPQYQHLRKKWKETRTKIRRENRQVVTRHRRHAVHTAEDMRLRRRRNTNLAKLGRKMWLRLEISTRARAPKIRMARTKADASLDVSISSAGLHVESVLTSWRNTINGRCSGIDKCPYVRLRNVES